MGFKKIVVAFSGGLDTSYIVGYLKEKEKCEIVTVTVDTGGFPPEELEAIKERMRQFGMPEERIEETITKLRSSDGTAK